MSSILEQLGLDQTFFVQLVIFFVVFVALSGIYFRPFLRLFEARHKRTVEDREAAERLLAQADHKFEEYKKRLAEEKAATRKEFEAVLMEARKEESAFLAQARDEARKITLEAAESAAKQQDQLKKQLEADIEKLAQGVSERLLSRKV